MSIDRSLFALQKNRKSKSYICLLLVTRPLDYQFFSRELLLQINVWDVINKTNDDINSYIFLNLLYKIYNQLLSIAILFISLSLVQRKHHLGTNLIYTVIWKLKIFEDWVSLRTKLNLISFALGKIKRHRLNIRNYAHNKVQNMLHS